jgi:hypothetical protein
LGIETVLERMQGSCGSGDGVKPVTKLRIVMLAFAALNEEYDREMRQLQTRTQSFEEDYRQIQNKYDGLMCKVAETLIGCPEVPEAQRTPAIPARTTATEATLYTETGALCGSVLHLESERISDLLNDAPRGELWVAGPSFELRGETNSDPEPTNRTAPARPLIRSAVHMVTLADYNAGRGAGVRGDTAGPPFVVKSPVAVSVETEDGSLFGSIHCAIGQEPQDVLNEAPTFISLTNVSVRLKSGALRFTVPYVALNKERIRGLSPDILADSAGLLEDAYFNLIKSRLGYS